VNYLEIQGVHLEIQGVLLRGDPTPGARFTRNFDTVIELRAVFTLQ
jgi:hypothetical protein